jgi:predicted O-methyltransferase YrrM
LRELYLHALAEKPQVVVECSSGTSTVILARCMQMNGSGKVFSLEHEPEYAEKTRRNLERHGLSEWATVLDAPLRALELNKTSSRWYALDALPADIAIDMLVIDGPPGSTNPLARYPAGPELFPRLSEHAAVFMDDAAREDEKAMLRLWETEFPSLRQTSRYCEKGCAVLSKRGPASQLQQL